MSTRRIVCSEQLPKYRRVTDDISLSEHFVGLHGIPAPQYTSSSISDSVRGYNHVSSGMLARSDRRFKCLAQRAAEQYFREVLKRERKMDIKIAIQHYKDDLLTSRVSARLQDIEAAHIDAIKMLFLKGRSKGLRYWVNQAIENIVVPELKRREGEDRKIWRSEQCWLSDSRQTAVLEATYNSRVDRITAHESEKFRIFGDIGTGYRTTGKDVHESGQSGMNAARVRAMKIFEELKGREDDMSFEFKRLQAICVERMQAKWQALIEHCIIQISLVEERGRARRYEPGHFELDAAAMQALMAYEADRMRGGLASLLATFSRSVEQKTQEFPPLRSFFQEFGPLTGSALRAAREVTVSRGIIYDNTFLKKNKLDLYAGEFYDAMKEHLVMLMVEAELRNYAWKERHASLSRTHTY